MILSFWSNSLSAGPKLLGVERGSNSLDLPAQLLLDATLHKKLWTTQLFFFYLPLIDLSVSVLF